jgi:hypothetical protein
MGTSLKDIARRQGRGLLCAVGAALLAATPAWAQTNPLEGVDIIRIEEDWVLDVADPEPNGNLPQIETVFGPSDPAVGTHAIFQVNHGSLPAFGEGGMQLQAWWGGYLVGYRSQFAPQEFNVAIEQVKYTTAIRVCGNGHVHLYVVNGHSLTWGDFALDGASNESNLHIRIESGILNLNNWNSQNSINHSRVTYGANRVNKYVRSAIRYYTAADLVNPHYTDTTETVIHLLAEAEYAPPPVNQ